jgi:hypothetical protein
MTESNKDRLLKDIETVEKEFKKTSDFPQFIYDGVNDNDKFESIYYTMVECIVILNDLLTIDKLDHITLVVMNDEFDHTLAELALLLNDSDRFNECCMYLIFKIHNIKQNCIDYQLYECCINIKNFLKLNTVYINIDNYDNETL